MYVACIQVHCHVFSLMENLQEDIRTTFKYAAQRHIGKNLFLFVFFDYKLHDYPRLTKRGTTEHKAQWFLVVVTPSAAPGTDCSQEQLEAAHLHGAAAQ